MFKQVRGRLLTVILALAVLVAPGVASAAAPKGVHNGAYVALGDSVATGNGLPLSAHPTAIDVACGLSLQAYPAVVSRVIGMPYVNAACSGAQIGNLTITQAAGKQFVRPQLDTAFSYGIPSLISITAGANDVHWQQMITTCFVSTCGGTAQTAATNVALGYVQMNMQNELAEINTRSYGNPPLTLVTGYYDPLSPSCSKLFSDITPAEVNWISTEVKALNTTIKNSTIGFRFAKYVPVTFQGHGMCDAAPWVQNLGNPAPFHPTAVGQNALAYVVLVAYNQAKAAGL